MDLQLVDDGLGLVFFVIIVCCLSYFVEKRRKAVKARFNDLGLTAVQKKRFKQWAHFGNFSILRKMGLFTMKADYYLGTYQKHKIGLFRHITPDTGTTARERVVVIIELDKKIPEFILRPEWLRDKIKSRFGYTDINFPEDTAFSEKYFLQGESENHLRIIFNKEFRQKIKSGSAKLWMECDGTRLLMAKENHSILSVESVEPTLTWAMELKSMVAA